MENKEPTSRNVKRGRTAMAAFPNHHRRKDKTCSPSKGAQRNGRNPCRTGGISGVKREQEGQGESGKRLSTFCLCLLLCLCPFLFQVLRLHWPGQEEGPHRDPNQILCLYLCLSPSLFLYLCVYLFQILCPALCPGLCPYPCLCQLCPDLFRNLLHYLGRV